MRFDTDSPFSHRAQPKRLVRGARNQKETMDTSAIRSNGPDAAEKPDLGDNVMNDSSCDICQSKIAPTVPER
jgi:hypothetical protein